MAEGPNFVKCPGCGQPLFPEVLTTDAFVQALVEHEQGCISAQAIRLWQCVPLNTDGWHSSPFEAIRRLVDGENGNA